MTKAFQIPPAACDGSYTAAVGMTWLPSPDFICQEKINGTRALLQIQPNRAGHNYLTGRRVAKEIGTFVEMQDQYPFIRDHVFPAELAGTIIDGEICDGVFWFFDVLFHKGRSVMDKPLRERFALLEKLTAQAPIWMRPVPSSNHPAEFLKRVLSGGGEGLVRKNLNETYGFSWSRVKFQESHDVVVLSVDLDKRAMRIGQWKGRELAEVGTVANLTEVDAKVAASHVGEVAEIICQSRDAAGKFYRPVFFRWRADKAATDCVFDYIRPGSAAEESRRKSTRLPFFGTGTMPRPA
ncbi:MAG: hypothetical protein HY301_19885 [Verrucomicrobia bacterium]|nr:hypothetical protein [Verrucomicrobiota bacterium]